MSQKNIKKPAAPKPPQDTYARRARELAAEVKRLRGWSDGDPAKAGALVDAVLAQTRHRLLGHAYAEAAQDVQWAVVAASKLVASHGPVGPYTPMEDAARSVTSTVYLATVQGGVGMAPAGRDVVDSIVEWKRTLPHDGTWVPLEELTAVWALLAVARGALADGDASRANAYADAARVRFFEAGLAADEECGLVGVDVERAVADARWAAGIRQDAVDHAERAVAAYEKVAAEPLRQPAALAPALLDRLLEPAAGVYGDGADRLVSAGDAVVGLQLRRRLIELLRRLPARLSEASIPVLASALAALSVDLETSGRDVEAEAAAAEAAELVGADVSESLRGERRDRVAASVPAGVTWEAPDLSVAFPRPEGVPVAPVSDTDVAASRTQAAFAEAAVRAEAEAEAARREAERQEAERRAAAQAERERAEAARLEAERAAAELAEQQRREAEELAAREETKRRRQERLEAHRLEQERLAAEKAEQERLAALDPEQLELERLAAELAALEAAEASSEPDTVDAEPVELDGEGSSPDQAAIVEAGRQAAEAAARAEAERLAAEEAEATRLAAERAEAERRAAEEAARAEAERRAAEEAERVAAEQAEAERLEAERVAAEEAARAEAERRAAEEAARAEAERRAAEEAARAEAERRAAEEAARAEAERRAAEEAARAEAERLAAEQAEAERLAAEEAARAEAERVAAEQAEAERLEAERVAAEEAVRAEAERLAAEEAARAEAERRAAEEAARAEAERAEAERLAAEEAARAEAARLAAEQAEAERLAAERAEAERAAAERAEAVRLEAERRAAEEAERLAAEEAARAEAERSASVEAARAEAAAWAQQAYATAVAEGGRRGVRDAAEALVAVLRQRVAEDPARWTPDLIASLEALADARWRVGDLWGSRAPAKEAKELAGN